MNTTKLNRNNARAENWVKSYFNSSFYGVEEFYNRPSYNKIRAEKECINRKAGLHLQKGDASQVLAFTQHCSSRKRRKECV